MSTTTAAVDSRSSWVSDKRRGSLLEAMLREWLARHSLLLCRLSARIYMTSEQQPLHPWPTLASRAGDALIGRRSPAELLKDRPMVKSAREPPTPPLVSAKRMHSGSLFTPENSRGSLRFMSTKKPLYPREALG